MSPSGACDEARDLAGELALGIADGEDRARVLEHAADCPDCRRELERLSVLADELLLLAPEREPPAGFEVRVLRAVQPRPARRRRLWRALPVAREAAMMRSGYDIRLAAGTITAGGTLGILIPPSVMLIVMGPVVGVPATDLFAAAVFPGPPRMRAAHPGSDRTSRRDGRPRAARPRSTRRA